jgi:hypothetical protein
MLKEIGPVKRPPRRVRRNTGRGRGKELWLQVAVKAISRYKVIGKDALM